MPETLEEAMGHTHADLVLAVEHVMRAVLLGMGIARRQDRPADA